MAGYYGSMAVVLKNNKALLGNKKRNTRKDYLNTKEVAIEDHIKATPQQLAEIRVKFQKERKDRLFFLMVLALLSFIITICLIYAISNMEWVGVDINRT